MVSPGHFDAAGILFRNDLVFVQIYGERYARSRRNGIEAVAIADVIGFDDRFDVVVQAIGTKHGDRFVLGFVNAGLVTMFSGAFLHQSTTSHHAAIAAVLLLYPAHDYVYVQILYLGEIGLANTVPVFDRRIPDLGERHQYGWRAVIVKLLVEAAQFGPILFPQGGNPVGIQDRHFHGAFDDHCLELLGPHDRPQSGTPGRSAFVGHDRRDEGNLFARGPYAGHLNLIA